MSDVSELLLKVKGVEKAKQDLGQVQSSMKKTGEVAKNMFTAMASGWGFKQLLEFGTKFSNFWEKNALAISNFKSIFGSFNKEAQRGVDLLKGSFDETERTAKIISNTIGNMLSDLNLSRNELGKVVTDLAGSVANIAAQHGMDIQMVARKIGSALRGEVDGLKELGIVIKKDSVAIQDAIKQFRSAGFGQREAEMMAIAKALIQNSLKFENSFTDIQMSFAHQIGNLKNTLESGVFVGIGKILNLLSPLLILLNKLLENKWVIAVASITSSIVLLTASMKLLMVTSKQLVGVMKFLSVSGMFGKDSNFSYVPVLLKRTFVEIAAVFEGGFVAIKSVFAGAIGGFQIFGTIIKDLAFNFKMFSKMQKDWSSKDFSKFVFNLSKKIRDTGGKQIGHTITNWLYKVFDFKWINNLKVHDFAQAWEKNILKLYGVFTNFKFDKMVPAFQKFGRKFASSITYAILGPFQRWLADGKAKGLFKHKKHHDLVKNISFLEQPFEILDYSNKWAKQVAAYMIKFGKNMKLIKVTLGDIMGDRVFARKNMDKIPEEYRGIQLNFAPLIKNVLKGKEEWDKFTENLVELAKGYGVGLSKLRKYVAGYIRRREITAWSPRTFQPFMKKTSLIFKAMGQVFANIGNGFVQTIANSQIVFAITSAFSQLGNKIAVALMNLKYSMIFKSSLVGGVAIALGATIGTLLFVAIKAAVDSLRTSPAVLSAVEKVKVGVLNVLYKLSLVGVDILASIRNFTAGEGFESDATKAKRMIQELNSSLPGLSDAFESFKFGVKEFMAEWNGLVKQTTYSIADYEKIKSQVEDRLKNAKKDFDTAEGAWKVYLDQAKYASEKAKEFAALNKSEEARAWSEEALFFKNAAEEERGKADKFLTLYRDLLGKYKEASSEIQSLTRKIQDNKFDTKNLFNDFDRDISSAFGKLDLSNSVKFVNEKIKALNEKFFEDGKFRNYFNNEEQRQYYIELANLEKSKFDLEIENLRTEEELIKQNRDLIQSSLQKMMEFKAQGIGGINANSAAGYKFMTSSIGDLSSLKPVLNNQNKEESMFREKTLSIQTKTKDILAKIKEKLDVLDSSERSSNIIVVN